MSKKSTAPDAWEDDWESLADKQDAAHESQEPLPDAKLSKAEQRARHAEQNKKIWESAENPEPLLFLEARNNVPVKAAFKPAVTVLSRKPPPKVLSRNGVTAGMGGLKLDDDEDSEEERRKKEEEAFAERKARAQRERQEKEKRYAEVRQRLFGSPTPTSEDSSDRASPNRQGRGKGRVKGGRDNQSRSSAEQSPASAGNTRKQLYDPGYSVKPNSVYIQRQESGNSRPVTPNQQVQPIREPRGPQTSGRGGNGFAPRGGRNGPDIALRE
jgi:hypothetical protein